MLREEVNILVVDDVNAMRVHTRDLLKSCGFKKIHLAGNGVEAQAFLKESEVHLVLADWQMQPCDGMELLRFVRSNAQYNGLAFIMMTAESTKERVLEAVKAGVDNYLVKPVSNDDIQTKVYDTLLKKKVL